ncbi:Ger(x)C family spore germination protein [Bacillus sp. EB600]|uniref:Ger(x)C family spore germination protein n=1 Tax=Bacillus sp. EB600 TaxID=2806345 RepID=UPI00210CF91B|nr:Ger(x)C family spore germination protein [Bacillus sp. EB600]MCQ6280451.1 Ger(x)C family spore germination protein [Bacillus sp. EB600]
MNKVISIFLMLLILISLLTGCWSSKELNELSIVTALGIDKTENGYLLSAQVINPGEIAGKTSSGRTEVIRFMKSGSTIFEAIRKLATDSPREIYVSHLRVVVFGEKLAKEGIGKTLDLLSRDHEMRSDFYMMVAKGSTAYDILNVMTHQEKLPANKLFNALDNSDKKWGPTTAVTLDELINNLVSKGKEPILTGVYVYGNPEYGSDFKNVQNISPKTGLRIDSIGVFKKDKLIGWLNVKESSGFNYIIDKVSSTATNVPCEDGKLAIETIRSKTKVKGKVEQGKPKITISVFSEGNVGDVECTIDVSKPENIKKLEEKYQSEIKDKIEGAIKKVQKDYKSDIFGFGEVIHRADPKAWKRLEPNWEQEFENIEVSVKVNAKIRRLGTITKSFQKEIGE